MSKAVSVGTAGHAANGVAVFGFSDGSLRRTDDFAASEPIVVMKARAGAAAIERVWWDTATRRPWWAFWRKRSRTTVYAVDQAGVRYRSDDDGLHWRELAE